jgi:MscS family membrane protein
MLQLERAADGLFIDLAKALGVIAVFWALVVAVGVVQRRLLERAAVTGRTEARSLIPLGARILRILLLFMGLVAVLAQFRYPVTTLLAGLGIGGVAVALGAQKTLENVLGSVAISVDRPFRVGDWIEVEGVSGLVEEIGLRSTRIRTMARTMITFPNGRLADQRIERHTARDRWLWNVTFGLTYDATVQQIEAIAADMERWLTVHPKIASGNVKFSGFGDYSLNLEVLSWFDTTDLWEFRELRQRAGFEIMRLIERHGARLAVPVQRVLVSGGPLPATALQS